MHAVCSVGARIVAERIEYLDADGKLVTESLRDYTKTALKKHFASLNDFLKRWKTAERKQAIVDELEAEGLPLDVIAEELGKNLDPFDLICHVAFDRKPLTRRERADNVKKRDAFTKYGGKARAVLDALLAKYQEITPALTITVGRPNAFHVFQHGNASLHEAIFRWSMIRMALEQRGKRGQRLVRTDLFKQLDPTEKGAVNYFLGLVICKLFAAKLLRAPWTLHLDVFKNQLQPGLLGGRSRPDMVAQSPTSMQWHAFECKGRASAPGDADKLKAKKQAQRLVNIGGTACTLHIGAITYYRQDVLEFYWRDPPADSGEPFELRDPSVGWEAYYAPFVEAYRYGSTVAPLASDAGVSARLEELDIGLGMHPEVGPLLLEGRWGEAREAALRLSLEALGVFQPDGLRIVAGSSWYDRLAPRASGRPPTRV